MNKFIITTIFVLTLAAVSDAGSPNFARTKPTNKRSIEVEFVGEGLLSMERPTSDVPRLSFVAEDESNSAKEDPTSNVLRLTSDVLRPTSDVPRLSFVAEDESNSAKEGLTSDALTAYTVGVDDLLEISVLQPDEILRIVNVAPDGMISFPYIGSIKVKDLTIPEIQEKVQSALADGYMRYPVVLVSLQESRSRKFFVYGEVSRPGNYAIAENTTVLRAISMAGGFTKFGSSSRVKVLRPKKNEPGYETIKIRIKKVMNGDSEEDILLNAGDMVVISEGMF